MKIKAVIFDMDGTLFDTERLFSDCFIEAASEDGWSLSRDTVIDCVGTTHEVTKLIVMEAMGADFPFNNIRKKSIDKFRKYAVANGIPFKNGVHRLLDSLDNINLPIGLATTSLRVEVEELLNAAGIIDRFTKIICGDDVENGKPHPEIYRKAAMMLGVETSEALVFEDSSRGICSASEAGARVIWVPDLQDVDEDIRNRCFREVGSLDAACDRLGELIG